jgi:signal transduction histidine kinase
MKPRGKPAFFSALIVWLCCQRGFSAEIGAHAGFRPGLLCSNVAQIRVLSPEEAARRHPVRLEGVVTYHNYPKTLFVQDKTGGIFVFEDGKTTGSLETGQRVKIAGVTGPGDFAPVVHLLEMTVTGPGELPEARKAAFEDLATGSVDSQWVELRGVVRAVWVNPNTGLPEMRVASGGGSVRIEVSERAHFEGFKRLVDATVRVRGAVGGIFNQERQMVGPKLFVPGKTKIFIDEAPPLDPFATITRPISSLLQYSSQGDFGHRVKVRGTVVFHHQNRGLFVRDETRGLSVQTQQTPLLHPGDVVEVLGFPALGEWMPVLQDAEFRRIGSASPPVPIAINAQQALDGKFDTDLITLEARLLEKVRRPMGEVLVMQADDLIFNAQLENGDNPLSFLRNNSQIRLTGICLVQVAGPAKQRQAFHILLRSPEDILVLKPAPYWTLRRVSWMLGITVAVLLLAMAWVVALRHRVRMQTQIIRQKAHNEAILEERSRIAREFHDTLEQELAGIVNVLDAIADTTQSAQRPLPYLDLARQMTRHSLTEARRSVWDLRSRILENGNLATALSEVAKPLTSGTALQISVREQGQPRRLPGVIENNLLRIGQEAITNIIKHGQARQIEIELGFEAENVTLCVRDDGKGFDLENAPAPSNGHFGLLGMRERAEKLQGKFQIRTSPGQGTQIQVEIPLQATNDSAAN